MNTSEKASALQALHEAPEILRLVNVWDAISARTVADLPGTHAIATAGHSIAASHGFADGEIPFDLALSAVERIVQATELPVTADLDAGFGDPGETVRRAIGVGVVGANVEDRLVPLTEAVANVDTIVQVAAQEGIAFQLNARTDAIVRGGDRPLTESLDDAISVAEPSSMPVRASCSCPESSTGSPPNVSSPASESASSASSASLARCPPPSTNRWASPASPTGRSPSVWPCAHCGISPRTSTPTASSRRTLPH
jgi:hypothetical protein